MAKVNQLVDNLIKDLPDRHRDILSGRFGLSKDNKAKTLASLGEQYNITRERVRQIEADGLRMAAEGFRKVADGLELVSRVKNHLESFGGVRRENFLVGDLRGILNDNSINSNQLRFLFEVAGEPFLQPENENFHDFWYLHDGAYDKAHSFIKKTADYFKNKKEILLFADKFEEVLEEILRGHDFDKDVAMNFLHISKKFGRSPYNDFGLSHWEEINPKTIRSKAYLVLKKKAAPLHFREIADEINEIVKNGKKAFPQTVHNELIKDPRVVLVGRGIYALKEHGFSSGTCREIISKILKEHGALSKEKIVELINKQRVLKENTIMLNLQNKKYFKRLENGKYQLARR